MNENSLVSISTVKSLFKPCMDLLLTGLLLLAFCSLNLAHTPRVTVQQSAEEHFKRGSDYLNKKDYGKAVEAYTEGLNLDAKNAKAYFNRGLAHFNLKDYDKAIEDATQAITIDPHYAEAFHNRGTAYGSKGRYTEALADLEQAIKLNPELAEPYFSQGLMNNALGNNDRAIAAYNRAIELNPQHGKAYYNRGTSFFRRKDYDRALSDYSKAVSLMPEEAMAYWARGSIYGEQEKYDQAIVDLTKAISLVPNDTKFYARRAEVYCAQGKKDLAAADENKIIELGSSVYDRCSSGGKPQLETQTQPDNVQDLSQLNSICAGMDNSYECARAIERHQIQGPGSGANRVGANLQLQLRNGRSVFLKDFEKRGDEAAVVKYSFREYFRDVGYFLAHRQFYEGSDYVMVHDTSGRRYALQDLPVISPDRQRLVTASNGISGGYSANAIQIWRLSARGLILEQTIAPDDWGPSDPEWTDNRTLRIAKNLPVFKDEPARKQTVTLRLNRRWQIVTP